MSKQARQASKTSTKTTAHRLVSPATMEQALPLPFGQQRRHMAPSRPARPHRALTWLRAASMAENGHGNVPALRTSLSSTDSKHKIAKSTSERILFCKPHCVRAINGRNRSRSLSYEDNNVAIDHTDFLNMH
ncbi:hypothetical protein Ae201684P_021899 [Aphanomyces euteiches]|nr:hypothetical protein Ae201684P_021899 [Aphanomyces euteiches]